MHRLYDIKSLVLVSNKNQYIAYFLSSDSIAEAWVITRHRAFNVEHAVYTAHNGFTFDIRKAFDPDFVDVLLAVVQRLQRLELTHEETCVLKATAFFFSGN